MTQKDKAHAMVLFGLVDLMIFMTLVMVVHAVVV